MITYTVEYWKCGNLFKKKLSKIKNDGIMNGENGTSLNYRYFILEDGSRLEVPMDNMLFKFDSNRVKRIQEIQEKNNG